MSPKTLIIAGAGVTGLTLAATSALGTPVRKAILKSESDAAKKALPYVDPAIFVVAMVVLFMAIPFLVSKRQATSLQTGYLAGAIVPIIGYGVMKGRMALTDLMATKDSKVETSKTPKQLPAGETTTENLARAMALSGYRS